MTQNYGELSKRRRDRNSFSTLTDDKIPRSMSSVTKSEAMWILPLRLTSALRGTASIACDHNSAFDVEEPRKNASRHFCSGSQMLETEERSTGLICVSTPGATFG